MAEMIPPLNAQTISRMTAGELRFARRLQTFLEDDYTIWYDIPIGRQQRYPDFIILHPSRGILCLEIKDWKLTTISTISSSYVKLLLDTGLQKVQHPLEQARDYTYVVVNKLKRDPMLCNKEGKYQGKPIMTWGWGCVFTNITRTQVEKAIPDDRRENLLPDHLMIYKDEMYEGADVEKFQEQLWGMFHYRFNRTLTMPEIDRIRWHLFPEIRLDEQFTEEELFGPDKDTSSPFIEDFQDLVKVMDIKQEKLARGLGEGHRVVHGVAGSGKTMILGCRCQYLTEETDKPILVLCFNVTLAAKIRAFISAKGIGGQVQVYHFHDWCGQQLKTYHVEVKPCRNYFERQVEAVISSVDKGLIPRAQYGAILIDEGHDFAAEWLQLIVQMVDPETNSLLLLYDDAQSIYDNRSRLDFSLSSVGVKAQGRTTILRLNYRNTHEILEFAYKFAEHYLSAQNADDDHIPLIQPEPAGVFGLPPVVCQQANFSEEVSYVARCLETWHQRGVPWNKIAVLYCKINQGKDLAARLETQQIPHLLMNSKKRKMAYNPADDVVILSTIHSSKGLEFSRVIIMGIGALKDDEKHRLNSARLLYVGMTRAQEYLLITTSGNNEYSQGLMNIYSTLGNDHAFEGDS
ncbi:MAG: 3'-5' exonuclease [Candidatus Electrothrix sp. GW3-4]|uniref:3'-5' exonuclease n=1 Tax=Candidatus Electrothrix sp. GW3-4 TaxID=3126740 RepID=UPI0030CB3C14